MPPTTRRMGRAPRGTDEDGGAGNSSVNPSSDSSSPARVGTASLSGGAASSSSTSAQDTVLGRLFLEPNGIPSAPRAEAEAAAASGLGAASSSADSGAGPTSSSSPSAAARPSASSSRATRSNVQPGVTWNFSTTPRTLYRGAMDIPPERSSASSSSTLPALQSGRTSSRSTATAPANSTSTSAGAASSHQGAQSSRRSRAQNGGRASNAIVLDDMQFYSDEQEEDDDFTVLSTSTPSVGQSRRAALQQSFQHFERSVEAFRAAANRPSHPHLRNGGPSTSSSAGSGSGFSPGSGTASVPRVEPPPVRNRSNFQIVDGIPAPPNRYRHRDRAVPFAGGAAFGAALDASARAVDAAQSVEEQALRRLGIYAPHPRYMGHEHRKLPDKFDTRWTHPHEAPSGFSNSIIEPPIELDADPGALPTGPLPDTTPICARCRYALQMGGEGDKKVWVLPCGHVIDGKCVRELSDPAWKKKATEAAAKPLQDGESKANGKARAISSEPEPPVSQKRTASMREAEDEEEGDTSKGSDDAGDSSNPPAWKRRMLDGDKATSGLAATLTRGSELDPIDPDVSSQSFEIIYSHKSAAPSSNGTAKAKGKATTVEAEEDDEPVVSGVKLQPVHFPCPVAGCGQLCFPKGDHDLSIIEMFL
ncbi:hypothetical protein OC835_003297 [Tilletia horrida]|nr:hypothetical protein OC835_003297 [Tilletia horrida]